MAVNRKVAASTQNQALSAIVFLYREIIQKELGEFENLIWAKKPSRLPVVFTQDEVKKILTQLEGNNWLMGQLLYGAGLRIMECVRLRVKDIDFEYKQVTVRDGKGNVDRVTMLPVVIIDNLKRHIEKVSLIHQRNRKKASYFRDRDSARIEASHPGCRNTQGGQRSYIETQLRNPSA